jgi:Ca-activated chloride channel family protein
MKRKGSTWSESPAPWLILASVAVLLAGCSSVVSKPQPAADPNSVELLFTYGSEKEKWLEEVTKTFNASATKTASGKPITVKLSAMGSGECIEGLLSETTKAHLTSPASGAYLSLGNDESQSKNKTPLTGTPKNLVLSPVVIAMWKPMAEAIGWGKRPVGWSDILAVVRNKDGWGSAGHPEWGSFKFGHTHPEYSNSGLISVLAEIYAATGKTENLTVADVKAPKTGDYLREIERAVVHYGSSTGFFGRTLFENGPAYLSAAVLYESVVIESYGPKYKEKLPFPVVAIYPKEGTFWSDHPVAIVNRPWVTADHKDAAEKYIEFLMKPEQQLKAAKHGFRPGVEKIKTEDVVAEFKKEYKVDSSAQLGIDLTEPKQLLDIPSAEVMREALKLWKTAKKHARIVLVFDRSGSMNLGGRLTNAKKGAREIIASLADEDQMAILTFSSTAAWAEKGISLKEGREKLNGIINGLFADGETALYDSIEMAFDQLQMNPDPKVIQAIVVLTDGEDNKSKLTLKKLVDKVKGDSEKKNVRIFTIAYGAEASKKDLDEISKATQARSYEGTVENIRAIFKDIATFF